MGYSPEWVAMSKQSITTIAPRFNVIRMVAEYVRKLYAPAALHGRRFTGDNFAVARAVAEWKAKVRAAWPGVRDAFGSSCTAVSVPDSPQIVGSGALST